MTDLAIIGGSGLTRIADLEIIHRQVVHTPFGEPSAPILHGRLEGREVVFLPRHGAGHTMPPHRINYRANIWALKHVGVQRIIAIAAVGGITPEMGPGVIAVPDQIIDYTWGRDHTFFEHDLTHVTHADFTFPYCDELREALIEAGRTADVPIVPHGTYGATQGPRLETIAEILRMERDGCDLVGMTAMPEASLARELDLCYAAYAVVANWAAGKAEGIITMEAIHATLDSAMGETVRLLRAVLRSI